MIDLRRFVTGMVALHLAAILFLPCRVQGISAETAIVVDATTGRVLFEKHSDKRSLIASTTKIMTALIVCEQCNVLDRVRIPKAATGIEGSSMYLQEGEIMTVQELLYGLMLSSGNDAAVALAIYCGGTVEGFVQLMNDKARALGMQSTHFENPHGLDGQQHYSTASDMALLASYAMNNPIFAKTVSTKTVQAAGRSLRNHNKLLWLFKDADGVKTGFTKAAGRILVSSAMRQGRRLVAVTMNAPDDWNDHSKMLTDGFSGYQISEILSKGDCVGTAEVVGGEFCSVELISAEEFIYPLADSEKTSIVVTGSGFVYAPIACGQAAGTAYVCVDGKPVGKVELVYGATVEQTKPIKRSFWHRWLRGIDG